MIESVPSQNFAQQNDESEPPKKELISRAEEEQKQWEQPDQNDVEMADHRSYGEQNEGGEMQEEE